MLIRYSFMKTDQGLKVYGMTVDEIDLVLNYRSRFAGVMTRDSVDKLMQTLENKNVQLQAKYAGK